jgi:hypothetical protein
MALRVPASQVPSIKKLSELSPAKIDEFTKALESADPHFNTFMLADQVSRQLDLPVALISEILRVLAGLYLTYDRERKSIDKFVDEDVFIALKTARVFGDTNTVDENWPKLKKFFAKALSFHRTVGTASKAGHILTQHERIFQTANVVTDVRPIFHRDLDEEPEAALIIHMLRITQRDRKGDTLDFYFAMDSNDIKVLKSAIERAMKKEETLMKQMKKANITCLKPGLVY